jgi:thiamine biosynthesis lipoprotein
MGTYYRVTAAALPANVSEAELRDTIEARLGEIDARMSTYQSDSEVSRFNRHPGTNWFPVSAETAKVVAESLHISRLSGGAFDITVGPLVNLWGFGPPRAADRGAIPSAGIIADTLRKTGSQHLHVRPSPPAIRKDGGHLQIDLSAIAKGYAVDSLAASLASIGIADYLVDIGGEMRASGHKLDHSPWNIGIERPAVGQRGVHKVLAVSDQAVATSGDYRNFFESEGRRYCHEIDPRTGRPIDHDLISVTVLDPSCMRADAWATALIVLGPQAGLQLVERENLATFFIIRGEDDGTFLEKQSTSFGRVVTRDP